MMSELFHFQNTLNRFFNNCKKSYWPPSPEKKLFSKSPALLGLIYALVSALSILIQYE